VYASSISSSEEYPAVKVTFKLLLLSIGINRRRFEQQVAVLKQSFS
jgi:hypothetical protein